MAKPSYTPERRAPTPRPKPTPPKETIEVPGMVIERGPTNVKPLTEAQKRRLRNLEYMRRYPTTSV